MQKPKSKQVSIEKRRDVVAANLLAGLNYRDIASGLGVSIGTVSNDVKVLMKRWREEQVNQIDDLVTVDLRRLDAAINAIWNDVKEGNLPAVDRLIRILERRSRMLGYDEPEKVELDWRKEAESAGIDADRAYKEAVAAIVAHLAEGARSDAERGNAGGAADSETGTQS